MTIQNMQFQQKTRASIQSQTNQMGQMATQLNQAQSQNSDKLPSQNVQIPKNVSAINWSMQSLTASIYHFLNLVTLKATPGPFMWPTPTKFEALTAQPRDQPTFMGGVGGSSVATSVEREDSVIGEGQQV